MPADSRQQTPLTGARWDAHRCLPALAVALWAARAAPHGHRAITTQAKATRSHACIRHSCGLLPHPHRSFGQPAILIDVFSARCRWPPRYLQLLSCHRRHQLRCPVLLFLPTASLLASAPAAPAGHWACNHVCLCLFYTRQPAPALKRAAGNCAAQALQGNTGIKQCIN